MNGQNQKPPLPPAGYAERSRGGDLLLRIRHENRPPIDAWVPNAEIEAVLEKGTMASLYRQDTDGRLVDSGTIAPTMSGKGLNFTIRPEGGEYTLPLGRVERVLAGRIKAAPIAELPLRRPGPRNDADMERK